MYKCPYCGNLNQGESPVCNYCKKILSPTGLNYVYAPIVSQKKKSFFKNKWLYITGLPLGACICMGFVILIAIGLSIFPLNASRQEDYRPTHTAAAFPSPKPTHTPTASPRPSTTFTTTVTLRPIPTAIPTPIMILSDTVNSLAQKRPQNGTVNIFGRLLFDDEPFWQETSLPPIFITMIGDPISFFYDKNTSEFILNNVPVGEYYHFEVIVEVKKNIYRKPEPGDYFSSGSISVDSDEGLYLVQRDIAIGRVIHMLEPFDNNTLADWDKRYEIDNPAPGGLLIKWDPVPGAATYKVVISIYQLEPWAYIEEYYDQDVSDTKVTVDIASSLEYQIYSLRLYAYNENKTFLGMSMIDAQEYGYGWSFDFRVK